MDSLPDSIPLKFMPHLVEEGMLIHQGVFSPDLTEYYYCLSDREFQQFDVKAILKEGNKWSKPKNAFFNSNFNEHGVCFSPDGKFLYFSSTRPVGIDSIPETWHVWRCQKKNGQWSEPEFVDIPNMRDKLVSHPSLTNDGTMYFHAGNIDYSDLNIYYAKQENGKFLSAIKLPREINHKKQHNTPFISADESFLIYEVASILYISFRDESGAWTKAKQLPQVVNKHGKGNPYISPDDKYLFYVAGTEPNPKTRWDVYWVDISVIESARLIELMR